VSSEQAAVRCERLSKVYQTGSSRVPALREVTASFATGALTAVSGPSGSGKSSLLRLVAGMDAPTEGRLWVDGVAVHAASGRTLRALRRRVGYVFQSGSENYVPYLTLDEHLRIALRTGARSPALPLDELLDVLEIAHRRHHRVDQLSGGEQARGAIAQVLAGGVDLIVADEPTAELDTHSAAALARTVRRLVGLGVTFVVASHDRALTNHANAVLRLEHGAVHRSASGRGVVSPMTLEDGSDIAGFEAIEEANAEAIVAVDGATKSFRRGGEVVHALVDVDLVVRAGESVGLVGRSGSGKTTLLNVSAGWDRPDAGRVVTLGTDPHATPPPWHELALVPQQLGLMRELTVRENVEHPLRLAGRRDDPLAVVDELLDELGLRGLADRRPTACSLGEQQRTAVARALVLGPRLLLADEPTAHLDAASGRAVFAAIERRVATGMAFVVATHDPDVLAHIGRVVSMSDGGVEAS
jgi:putative ABC transport system ATP-binding protein